MNHREHRGKTIDGWVAETATITHKPIHKGFSSVFSVFSVVHAFLFTKNA